MHVGQTIPPPAFLPHTQPNGIRDTLSSHRLTLINSLRSRPSKGAGCCGSVIDSTCSDTTVTEMKRQWGNMENEMERKGGRSHQGATYRR